MIKCNLCGKNMVWNIEYTFEDYGIDEDGNGIVNEYSCDCGCYAQLYTPDNAKIKNELRSVPEPALHGGE